MKIYRYLLVPAVLAAVLALAACGGSSGNSSSAKLSSSDVAVVGGQSISKTQFDDLMQTAKASYKSNGKTFPKAGTSAYDSIKTQAMTLLVQEAEREQKAKSLGITVTPKQVQTRLNQIKQQYFGGSESKYLAQLKTQGLTDAQVRSDIKSQMIADALFAKVTKNVTVSDAEVQQYYAQHPQSYTTAASRTVRHILVKTKAQAEKIEADLKAGQSFATLAKKYSLDPGSKAQGGKLTISKGQTVAPFDHAAFSLKTGQISAPVHSQYGWHVIQALTPVKPASKTPEKQVAAAIKQQLLTSKKNTAMNAWVTQTEKDYCTGSQIKYQPTYTPSPDPCATLAAQTTAPTTTG